MTKKMNKNVDTSNARSEQFFDDSENMEALCLPLYFDLIANEFLTYLKIE
jgi:hypothetical protein